MTFEREMMAALCLGIVWVNSGLIVAHAWGDLRGLARLRRKLAGTVGRSVPNVPSGQGDSGPVYRLVQAGRSRGAGTIHFHDRRTESAYAGTGRAEIGGQWFELAPEDGGVWVWPSADEVRRATQCQSHAEFDALAKTALHARGAERIALVKLGESKVAGGTLKAGRLVGTAQEPLIFSATDPRSQLLGLERRVALGIALVVLVVSALTALCFVGPAFGTLSKIGAFALLVYFLTVQPLSVWLSESVRLPHELTRGGTWVRARLPQGAPYELEAPAASS